MADDSVWWELRDIVFSAATVSRADVEIDGVLAATNAKASRVLDMCCGRGRHSMAFGRRGIAATGVERCPRLVQACRSQADAEQLPCEFVLGDAAKFKRPNTFELALLLFSSHGYSDRAADDVATLQAMWHSLRPGGYAVVETVTKETVARWFRDVSVAHPAVGVEVVRKARVVDNWSVLEHEWTLLSGDSWRRHSFSHRIYSASEIVGQCRAAGFASVKVMGDFSGAPYGVESRRAVVIAQRGAE